MRDLWISLRRLTAAALVPVALFLAACESDTVGPPRVITETMEVAVLVNSTERSLTIVPVDDPESSFTIGVSPEGSPVEVAARNEFAVVPLGTYPFAAVVDLAERKVTHTVALPEGSGATGAAFLNDSIALVGNPGRNSVSPVNVLRGSVGAEIEVGVYPEFLIEVGGKVYVLNAELEDWVPVRPGTISVIDETLQVTSTIELSGYNPGDAAVGADGRLYILNAGSWGADNGSLSIVDLARGAEAAHHEGFGNFPGSIAVAPNGRVMVGIYEAGIAEWNPAGGGSFIHGPEDPLTPGNVPPVSGIGYDSEGRLVVIYPGGCLDPGTVYLLDSAGEVEAEAATGVCPMGLTFTELLETW